MPAGIIINPISGSRGHRADAVRARRELAERGARACGANMENVEIVVTEASGHAHALSQTFVARGMDVVAWGGDGTVNETAGPVIGSSSVLGIVPSGSGDGLARGLGLPLDPIDALRVALTGRARVIDAGYVGDKHFLNIAGVGFDAAVATAFNARSTRGLLGYVATMLAMFWSYESEDYELSLDNGGSERGRRLQIGFANAPQYGNGLVLAANADPSDGILNVVSAEAAGSLRQLWRMRQIAVGSVKPQEGVQRVEVRSARVTGSRLIYHVDGETFATSGTLEVRIKPAALRIRVSC